MNPDEIKRLVDQIYLEKGIDRAVIFRCIEEALMTAAKRHGSDSDDSDYQISIDPQTGEIYAYRDNVPITTEQITARAGAQSARQSITQKIREAVRDAIYERYTERLANGEELVFGVVQKIERNGAVVLIDGKQEAWLPNSNRMRNEVYSDGQPRRDKDGQPRREGQSVRPASKLEFVIESVEKVGLKVRIVLSRKSKLLLRRLFERECPEIRDGSVEIMEISRDAGTSSGRDYGGRDMNSRDPGCRSKIAVRSNDPRLDPLGVCLGVHNSRMMSVSNALNGERIDVVVWSDDTRVFIQNSLSPAKVDEVILCPRLDRAFVMVKPDQLRLAIGKRGQNVNLAKKLLGGWELEILTHDGDYDELRDTMDRATAEFQEIEGVTPEFAEAIVDQGFTSYYDLSCIEPEDFMEITGASREQTDLILERVESLAEEQERLEEERRKAESSAGNREKNARKGDKKGNSGASEVDSDADAN